MKITHNLLNWDAFVIFILTNLSEGLDHAVGPLGRNRRIIQGKEDMAIVKGCLILNSGEMHRILGV